MLWPCRLVDAAVNRPDVRKVCECVTYATSVAAPWCPKSHASGLYQPIVIFMYTHLSWVPGIDRKADFLGTSCQQTQWCHFKRHYSSSPWNCHSSQPRHTHDNPLTFHLLYLILSENWNSVNHEWLVSSPCVYCYQRSINCLWLESEWMNLSLWRRGRDKAWEGLKWRVSGTILKVKGQQVRLDQSVHGWKGQKHSHQMQRWRKN